MIALPDLTQTAGANWTTSCVITGRLIARLRGMAKFRSGNHTLLMREGKDKIQRRHAEETETALGEARADTLNPDAQRLRRIQRTGAWLLVPPSIINGSELRA